MSSEFIFSLDKILYYSLRNKKELKFFAEKAVKSSHRRRSVGKGVLRNFAKFTGKPLCQSLSSASLRPATLLKRGSGTGVLLWILWEHLFYTTPLGDCFWTVRSSNYLIRYYIPKYWLYIEMYVQNQQLTEFNLRSLCQANKSYVDKDLVF